MGIIEDSPMEERVLVAIILAISLRFNNRGISGQGKKG